LSFGVKLTKIDSTLTIPLKLLQFAFALFEKLIFFASKMMKMSKNGSSVTGVLLLF